MHVFAGPRRAIRRTPPAHGALPPCGVQPAAQVGPRRAHLDIPDRQTAVLAARAALYDVADTGTRPLGSHAQMLVSELVSSRAAGGDAETGPALGLDIWLTDSCLRVELTDEDHRLLGVRSASPAEPPASEGALELVAALADRWGVRRDMALTLWFELDL